MSYCNVIELGTFVEVLDNKEYSFGRSLRPGTTGFLSKMAINTALKMIGSSFINEPVLHYTLIVNKFGKAGKERIGSSNIRVPFYSDNPCFIVNPTPMSILDMSPYKFLCWAHTWASIAFEADRPRGLLLRQANLENNSKLATMLRVLNIYSLEPDFCMNKLVAEDYRKSFRAELTFALGLLMMSRKITDKRLNVQISRVLEDCKIEIEKHRLSEQKKQAATQKSQNKQVEEGM